MHTVDRLDTHGFSLRYMHMHMSHVHVHVHVHDMCRLHVTKSTELRPHRAQSSESIYGLRLAASRAGLYAFILMYAFTRFRLHSTTPQSARRFRLSL